MEKKLIVLGLGGCGKNFVERSRKLKIKECEFQIIKDVNEEFKSNKNYHYVLIAGLGGKTGTSLILQFAREFKKLDISVQVIVTTPFAFEGAERMKQAGKAFWELNEILGNNITIIPNDIVLSYVKSMSTMDGFKYIDGLIYSALGIENSVKNT